MSRLLFSHQLVGKTLELSNGVAFLLPTAASSDEPENLVEFSDCSIVSCLDRLSLKLCLLTVEFFCRTKALALMLGE